MSHQLSVSDICRVIRECKKRGVDSIDIDGISIQFVEKEEKVPKVIEEFYPSPTGIPNQAIPLPLEANPPSKVAHDEQIEPDEPPITDDGIVDLAVTDPQLWEEMAQKRDLADANDQ